MTEQPYRFRFLDHTADVAVEAYGDDLPQLFASAARAMFEVLADVSTVEETLSRGVEVESEDVETLLVDWLNELLFLFDADGLLLNRFLVRDLHRNRLSATVYGERVDPARHRIKTGIKAVTYHMLEVICDPDGCVARVVFDV